MRILILTQYFWPEEFRINDLAVELDRRGHQVCVLTGWPNYPQGRIYTAYRATPNAYFRLGNVEVIRVPLVPRGTHAISLMANYVSFSFMAATVGIWKMRGRPFDAILVNQLSPATVCLPGIVLRKLKRAPTFLWVQDIWPDALEAVGAVRSRLILRSLSRLMVWIYAHMDHILVQSNAFLDRLRPQLDPIIPITYLPNWAQPGSDGVPDVTARLRSDRGTFDIYYLGNLGEAQDFPAVLDAISRLAHRDDLRWYLVGDGRRENWIREQLASRHLEGRVTMLGPYPMHNMPPLYAAADALLLPLKGGLAFELTLPSKVQTYLAAGVPIIAMLDGEGARIIRESRAGYTCHAGDSAALAETVETMMGLSAEDRAGMGRAGRAYNKAEFDFQRIVNRFEALLKEYSR
jgi:colanic acid biosynthesis glycosyl transferase WcaI